ncbi:MAG: hypothetical protein Q7S35_06575 [Candidatus Limnocylindrales bacterium]|nr:hypothetical protein [Candidatus Limnocylindrales bacterium]
MSFTIVEGGEVALASSRNLCGPFFERRGRERDSPVGDLKILPGRAQPVDGAAERDEFQAAQVGDDTAKDCRCDDYAGSHGQHHPCI